MGFLDTILGVLFPVYCLSCRKRGAYFCAECLSACPPAERESAEWVIPLFDYRHPPVKAAIWLIKYKGRKKAASIFAEILYGAIMEELSDLVTMENFKKPLLVPIPLSKQRKRERGFNQAELLCKEIIKLDKARHLTLGKNLLMKDQDTEHQARIKSRAERLKNLHGSFSVKNPDMVKGKNIILVDDVTTTGATLLEAKKALKNSGARKVIAFTIAH